jgi:hypothetical protein
MQRRKILNTFAGASIVLAILSILYITYLLAIERFWQREREIRASLESLADHRPPGANQKEWEFMVCWTEIGAGNFLSPYSVDFANLDQFGNELSRRIQAGFDASLIDWIWDEFERISETARRYTHWRPTRPERLQMAATTTC